MEIALLAVLALGILVATYRDVQVREVPDLASYGLIVTGILGGLILAILASDVSIFLEHLAGFFGGLLLGLVMFYGRQWGGGDAKLLMGVGAILGLSKTNLSLPAFFILLIFMGAIYGILYTLGLAITHRDRFLPALRNRLRSPPIHRLRIGLVATGIIVLALIVMVPFDIKVLLGVFLLSAYLLTYSWIVIKTIEEHVLIKRYPAEKLTEGDWVIETIMRKGKVIVDASTTGITNQQIAQLKEAKVKHVMVREGIPFVPAFLLALIALMVLEWIIGPAVFSWLI